MFKIEKFNVSFKEQTLYQDAQLNLQGPGLYALVAKNGTGKSIFFKSLMGCIKSSFRLSIDGHNHKESLELISYVAAENNLFNSLTLMENLQLFSSDLDFIEQYLERFKLQDRKRIKCKKLSAGERQRAAIILGILEGNPVLLLDEPISHLDEETSKLILDNLKVLSKEKYIIFSTHKFSDYKGIDGSFTIKNHSFEMIMDMKSSIEECPKYESAKIDKRILSKIVFWGPNIIVTLLLSLLFSIFLLSFTYKSVSKEDIYLKLLKSSAHNPYIIDTYWSNSTFDDQLVLPMSDLNKYEEKIKQGNLVVLCSNFLQADDFKYDLVPDEYKNAFLVEPFFNAYFITNKFLDFDLKDNEIILSDFMYDSLKDYNVIEESNNFEWLSLYEKKIQIKYVFPTQYSYWWTFSEEMEIRAEEMVEYLNEYNYIYHRCYLNQETYNALKKGYYAKCQTLELRHALQNINLGIYENASLAQGRAPRTEDEVVISKRYYNLLFRETSGFDQEKFADINLFDNNDRISRNFSINKKIIGILEDNSDIDVLFYNNEALNEYFDTGYKHSDTWSYDPKSLSKEDIISFDKSGLFLASEYDYAIHSSYQHYEGTQNVISVLFGISIGFIVIFYLLSMGFYFASKRKSFKLLHMKKKTMHAVSYMIFISSILNIFIGALAFFGTAYLLCAVTFNPYLKGVLGIPLSILHVHMGLSFGIFFVFSFLLLLKYVITYKN